MSLMGKFMAELDRRMTEEVEEVFKDRYPGWIHYGTDRINDEEEEDRIIARMLDNLFRKEDM